MRRRLGAALAPALGLPAAALLLFLAEPGRAQAGGGAFPVVAPEAVGFSTERLERLDRMVQRTLDQKDFAGVVLVAARHGKVFLRRTYGKRDLSDPDPMAVDAIFRIYSMSKPVTAVAMMILYEEGKWSAQDPIAKYIPEFAHLKVFKGLDARGAVLVEEPVHAPMMRELMTHTAGFGYGNTAEPADALFRGADGRNAVLEAPSLQEMINRLARIPLLYQPGQRWFYSASADVEGYLIEKLSGQTFPQFVQQRIFGPLGMKDSAFFVPREKRGRFAAYYQRNGRDELEVVPDSVQGPETFAEPPARPSGGGGIVSTAPDYLRFAEMLRRGGEVDGARILGPETVRMMSQNHLPPRLMIGEIAGWNHAVRPGFGFGFGVGVYTEPALADETLGRGSFLWGGAAGTFFWVDPEFDLVCVGMVQRLATDERPNLEELSRQALYQALLHPNL